MKVSVQVSLLQQAVSLVGAVIPSRSNRPVLENIKLLADEGGLTLFGSDQEISIRKKLIAVSVDEPGELLVPAGRFQAILRELGGDRVTLSTDGHLLSTVSETGVFKLYGLDPSEYPEVPEIDPSGFNEMNPEGLARALEAVEVAVAKDLGRFAVNGVLFRLNESGVDLAATDGRRFAFVHKPLGSPPTDEVDAIVSTKGVNYMRRMLSSGMDEDLVGLRIESDLAVLRTATTQIISRAIDGKFPSYHKLLTRDLPYSATVETSALNAAARRASIMAGSDIRAMHMRFLPDAIEISARDEGCGEVQTSLPAVHDAPENTNVYVNPDLIVDLMRLPLPPQLSFRFGGVRFPLIFKPSEDHIYFVSPVTTE